jgi:hypothetical protein
MVAGILKKPFRSPKKYRPRLKRFSIPRSIIASSTHPTPLQPSTSSANKTLEAELIQGNQDSNKNVQDFL